MIRVAFTTRASRIQSAVIAAMGRHVGRDLLVAAETEFDLRSLFKWNVALATARLDVGMSLNHLARHNQRLKIPGDDGLRKRYEQQARDTAQEHSEQRQRENGRARPRQHSSRQHATTC